MSRLVGRPSTTPCVYGYGAQESMGMYLTILALAEGIAQFKQHTGAADLDDITGDAAQGFARVLLALVPCVNLAYIFEGRLANSQAVRRAVSLLAMPPQPPSMQTWELAGTDIKSNAWKYVYSNISPSILERMLDECYAIITFATRKIIYTNTAIIRIDDGSPRMDDVESPLVFFDINYGDLR